MKEQRSQECPEQQGMYDPSFEHDNCGIGAVVNIKGIKSHKTVEDALSIVENLEHRAGKDAEGKTGDGVGIMVQISHKFFSKECAKLGIELGGEREYGIGMFFLPQDELKRNQAKKMFEIIVEKEGMNFLGWREVTTNPKVLGSKALEKMPSIMQAFIQKPEDVEKGLDFDRKLYIARRVFEQSIEDTYVVSCSSRTLIYKGMFLVGQLRSFFQDLQSPDYESAIALVHSRFSTNTMPSWERAHPYRFLVHNGEINTIKGNADKMLAREETVESEHLKGEFHKILPVISASGSDSAMLDNTLEFLVMSGMDLALAVMILIPEPWLNNRTMSQKKKDFYQYYATMMEPWDGPASILFTDGDVMGAVLDRNGLRPSRYYVTTDDQLILSSEVGVLDIDPSRIVEKERLHPGKMLLVDTKQGKIIDDDELKEYYANRQPYGEWLDHNLVNLSDLKIPNQRIEEFQDGKPYSPVILDSITFGDSTDYELTYANLMKTPKGKQLQKVKELQIMRTLYGEGQVADVELAREKISISSADNQYTFYFSNASYGLSCSIVEPEAGQSIRIIDSSNYYATVEITGITEPVELEAVVMGREYILSYAKVIRQLHTTGTLETWSNPLVSELIHAADLADWIGDYLQADREYELSYRGEARIDANDLIFLENKYVENMQVRISEHQLTYNGALSGTIKVRRVE